MSEKDPANNPPCRVYGIDPEMITMSNHFEESIKLEEVGEACLKIITPSRIPFSGNYLSRSFSPATGTISKLMDLLWIRCIKFDGYEKAGEISGGVGEINGQEAFTEIVGNWIFDEITDNFVSDVEHWVFLKRAGPTLWRDRPPP